MSAQKACSVQARVELAVHTHKASNYRHFSANVERLCAHHLLKLGDCMRYIIAILGFVLVTMMLWDAFEVIILPRHVTHRFRFSKFFYRSTWQLRSVFAEWITGDKRRESYLSIFGPFSLLLLLGVCATGIIAGFAMLQWGLQDRLNVGQSVTSFLTYLYMSGTTFFTLGLGDVIPWGRVG